MRSLVPALLSGPSFHLLWGGRGSVSVPGTRTGQETGRLLPSSPSSCSLLHRPFLLRGNCSRQSPRPPGALRGLLVSLLFLWPVFGLNCLVWSVTAHSSALQPPKLCCPHPPSSFPHLPGLIPLTVLLVGLGEKTEVFKLVC